MLGDVWGEDDGAAADDGGHDRGPEAIGAVKFDERKPSLDGLVPHLDAAGGFGKEGGGNEGFVGEDHGLRARSGAGGEGDDGFIAAAEDSAGDAAFVFSSDFSDWLLAEENMIEGRHLDCVFLSIVRVALVDEGTVEIEDVFDGFGGFFELLDALVAVFIDDDELRVELVNVI